MAERNREVMIERLQGDPRLGGAKVVAAMPLMRVSIFVAVFSGVIGAIVFQLVLGQGGLQFGLGMVAGYLTYWAYLMRTMGEPRVLGVMAVLTTQKLILLGSRRKGIVGEYEIPNLESLNLLRKGNLLVMGKLVITPVDGDRLVFMTTNKGVTAGFVAEFEELRRRGYGE